MTSTPLGDGQRIQLRNIDALLLDPRNPRIFVDEDVTQTGLIRELYRTEALDELASSFTNNGYFTEEPVVDWDTANKSDRQRYGKFFHAMLEEGVYLAPSQFEAGFVSLAHTDQIIERTVAAARKAFTEIQTD